MIFTGWFGYSCAATNGAASASTIAANRPRARRRASLESSALVARSVIVSPRASGLRPGRRGMLRRASGSRRGAVVRIVAMNRRHLLARISSAGAALVLAGIAAAQSSYPDKPITMIVPFPPGGVADTVARPVAEAMARELKQPVVVENRAGAGGALGIGVAARAPADGYTVLMSLSSISILPEADKLLGRKPSYQLSQFRPIARFTADPTVLVVRADARWKTLAEFIADAK